MTRFKIFHSDEIPEKASGKKSVYPFESLKILDGFSAGKYEEKLLESMNKKCQHYSEKLDCTFVTRKVGKYLHIYRSE